MSDSTQTIYNKELHIYYAERIIVRGIVQGVGFRPTVWRIARSFQLVGNVSNNGEGVVINVQGSKQNIDDFIQSLLNEKPNLSRIDDLVREPLTSDYIFTEQFEIISSTHSKANTGIMADVATCDACLMNIYDENNGRYQYPFTNCTHCGPRLSIIRDVPYDRSQTSMAEFPMCDHCQLEYNLPSDRRFHAQPNACSNCGPHYWLTNNEAKNNALENVISKTAEYLRAGKIIAIKGIGGFHLAVSANQQQAVKQLRSRKQRPCKPFALMAKDVEMVEQFCYVSEKEKEVLKSTAAPIVLLQKKHQDMLAANVALGQTTLGFMLPYSPLHHLLLNKLDHPIILTSANSVQEPACIDNEKAIQKLNQIADYFLLHNRKIENRVDDSVIRLMANSAQLLRRSRGYAPQSIILPEGFENTPQILALGGELKNTFCLLKNGQAFLSQHMGDLENYSTYCDFRHNLTLYQKLFQHQANIIAVDAHPDYIASKTGYEIAENQECELQLIQHHHAHIASCLADNNYPLNGQKVLGIVLDGLGFGNDGTLWGGEFILANYYQSERLGHLKPIALLGGSIAMKQPWRNVYAQIQAYMNWNLIEEQYGDLPLIKLLSAKPLATMDAMLEKQINCPLASSAGRLFDAVAAAVGICFDYIQYEGQAAIELEACITNKAWKNSAQSAYPFKIVQGIVDASLMWNALLEDLSNGISVAHISARFHKGLSNIIQQQANVLATRHNIKIIALSGGVFQNKTLFEDVVDGLQQLNLDVLYHKNIPANDGGLSLGQAVIAAAKIIEEEKCA